MNARTLKQPSVLTTSQEADVSATHLNRRHLLNNSFKILCMTVASISVVLLGTMIVAIFVLGTQTISTTFLTAPPSPNAVEAGFYPAMMGSVWLLILVMLVALPIGVATAIMLEEFVPRKPILKSFHSVIQANITNLAGVPSVVYGIIGLTIFVSMFQLFGNENKPAAEVGVRYFDQFFSEVDQVLLVPVEGPDAPETALRDGMTAYTSSGQAVTINVIDADADWPQEASLSQRTLRDYDYPGRIHERTWYYFRIPFGRGILSGALTLTLVILPIIIIASQEALRAVPSTFREAALGMGATRWQTVQKITLPCAIPSIMTGTIIALSRAIGEAAPLLMIAGIVFISNPPGNIMDDFTAMPLQIYNWAQRPQAEFHDIAASGIIVLLMVLLCFNAIAVFLRQKFQKPMS